MADDLVMRAREALDGVTPGPWFTSPDGYRVTDKAVRFDADGARHGETPNIVIFAETEANARFIAASRELVPAMVERIRELEDQLATVLQREADTHARHDAKVEALEAEVARLAQERDKYQSEAEFFQSEVKLRNRIPATSDAMADMLRRAEAAEAEVAKLETAHAQMQQTLDRLTQERDRAREALEWYGEQARLARLIHSEGDKGRNAIAADGGNLARATLKEIGND